MLLGQVLDWQLNKPTCQVKPMSISNAGGNQTLRSNSDHLKSCAGTGCLEAKLKH